MKLLFVLKFVMVLAMCISCRYLINYHPITINNFDASNKIYTFRKECIPDFKLKDIELIWSNSQLYFNESEDPFWEFFHENKEQAKILDGENLKSEELYFLLEQMKLFRAKNNENSKWFYPNDVCMFPVSGIIENPYMDTLFSLLIRFNGTGKYAKDVQLHDIIKQNRKAIAINYYSAPVLYSGGFLKIKNNENSFFLKTWLLRRFDPEQQWILFQYNFFIKYDIQGWLQSAVVEAKPIDFYSTNPNAIFPAEMFYVFTERYPKGIHPATLTTWHWRYLPSFDSDHVMDVLCLKRHFD